jgi:hypothetical protein
LKLNIWGRQFDHPKISLFNAAVMRSHFLLSCYGPDLFDVFFKLSFISWGLYVLNKASILYTRTTFAKVISKKNILLKQCIIFHKIKDTVYGPISPWTYLKKPGFVHSSTGISKTTNNLDKNRLTSPQRELLIFIKSKL